MIDLFQRVDFKSHSGLDLTWKIEMDALTPKEWDCISTMILEPVSYTHLTLPTNSRV